MQSLDLNEDASTIYIPSVKSCKAMRMLMFATHARAVEVRKESHHGWNSQTSKKRTVFALLLTHTR